MSRAEWCAGYTIFRKGLNRRTSSRILISANSISRTESLASEKRLPSSEGSSRSSYLHVMVQRRSCGGRRLFVFEGKCSQSGFALGSGGLEVVSENEDRWGNEPFFHICDLAPSTSNREGVAGSNMTIIFTASSSRGRESLSEITASLVPSEFNITERIEMVNRCQIASVCRFVVTTTGRRSAS
jgi:hypothetical protein